MSRRFFLFALLATAVIALFVAELAFGSVYIPPEAFAALATGRPVDPGVRTILLDIRLLKAVTALLAGMALTVAGLQMQTLFDNPLAGPYVLGLSSGASLGVALVMLTGAAGTFSVAGAALAGAAAVMLLLLAVNRRVANGMTLLILGVMFSSAVSAVVQILQYLTTDRALKGYVVWTMGSLGEVTAQALALLGGLTAIGLLLAVITLKALNLLALGPTMARSLGLDLRRARTLLLVSSTLLAGSVTAFCGPIGFIGLAIPHVARALCRTADHRILLPATALLGAATLLGCDLIARGWALPINSITALVGIPIIIYVIIRSR